MSPKMLMDLFGNEGKAQDLRYMRKAGTQQAKLL